MKKILFLLLLAVPSVFADAPREPFPSDYRPLSCARPDLAFKSFEPGPLAAFAQGVHRANLREAWVNDHWNDLLGAFKPLCTKMANCLAVPGNPWSFCTDFMREAFLATADRYPKNSDDWLQWRMAAHAYMVGLDENIRAAHKESQDCAASQASVAPRKLEVWTQPEKIGADYDGTLTVYAVDAETHVPVMALITVEGQTLAFTRDSPDGRPMSHYPFKWPVAFEFVQTKEGHRDLVVPAMVLTANGYETLRRPMPIDPPKLIVEMTPPVSQLQRGKNTVTITARDAVTAQPVEMRVMGGDSVLGDSNKPFVLEIAKGQKRPEIWLTSLFDRYGDVVVAKKE